VGGGGEDWGGGGQGRGGGGGVREGGGVSARVDVREELPGIAPGVSHRMYLVVSFRESTPQKNENLFLTITNSNIKLTVLCGG
jgi:hypothetical protein